MIAEYRSDDASTYQMSYGDPHRELEPLTREIAVVDAALARLLEAGILPHAEYDGQKMLAHRAAVAESFEIPWTAISPRMQRLLYAINAILRPNVMIAAGVFCGNTFISNAGAAVTGLRVRFRTTISTFAGARSWAASLTAALVNCTGSTTST